MIAGNQDLIDRCWEYTRVHGPVLHPFEAWLLARGLKTFPIRMPIHNDNAQSVAEFLLRHPMVEVVNYPGLPSHPQHELAKRQMSGFGGMLSFQIKGGYGQALRVLQRVEVCTVAVSLGGMETLLTHPASMIFAHQTEDQKQKANIHPALLRMSVGLENVEDIIADLEQALR